MPTENILVYFCICFAFYKQYKNLYISNTPIYGVLNIFYNPLLYNIFKVKCLMVSEHPVNGTFRFIMACMRERALHVYNNNNNKFQPNKV